MVVVDFSYPQTTMMRMDLEKNLVSHDEFHALDNLKGGYSQYQALPGRLSQKDYGNVIARARQGYKGLFPGEQNIHMHIDTLFAQASGMARLAGIILSGPLDPRALIYAVLRRDEAIQQRYFKNSTDDQYLFAEALQILGDDFSLDDFERILRLLRKCV